MYTIEVDNVNEALPIAMMMLKERGVWRNSRAGRVIEAPFAVSTTYKNPMERVLFCPTRDANPIFHLMEALWMLAGRNDVRFVKQFNSRMVEYSDDGETFHGAYGYRWRQAFEMDQIHHIIRMLQADPESRRAVLQMWDVYRDLRTAGEKGSKDVPCNLLVTFKIRDDNLDMTVFCRSNDVVWGAYGANVVHFSILQEYIAASLDVGVGRYTQVSDSFHVYEPLWEKLNTLRPTGMENRYAVNLVAPHNLVDEPATWDIELGMFMSSPMTSGKRPENWDNTFFGEVAVPIFRSYRAYQSLKGRKYRFEVVFDELQSAAECDWKTAASLWYGRRMDAASLKGVQK